MLKDDEDMSPREPTIMSNASTRTVSLLYSCQREAKRMAAATGLGSFHCCYVHISTRDSDNSSLRTERCVIERIMDLTHTRNVYCVDRREDEKRELSKANLTTGVISWRKR
jgi:phage host-nuclease inhibitor protein Gam